MRLPDLGELRGQAARFGAGRRRIRLEMRDPPAGGVQVPAEPGGMNGGGLCRQDPLSALTE